jgi:hypothetical protein
MMWAMAVSLPVRLRYVIVTVIEEPCDEPGCTGHTLKRWRYSLPSAERVEAQVGDVYVHQCHDATPEAARAYGCAWDNCDGRHLYVMIPDDDLPYHGWNVDGRANNCDMKDERTHRCWVRHGDPSKGEALHVDKDGHTCHAGAGSIQSGDFHGHVHNGMLTKAP